MALKFLNYLFIKEFQFGPSSTSANQLRRKRLVSWDVLTWAILTQSLSLLDIAPTNYYVCLLFIKTVPSSGLNHVCMILVALFSFQRTPSLVILPQYCVASSSPSIDVRLMYVSVRFVVAPCLATKFLRD